MKIILIRILFLTFPFLTFAQTKEKSLFWEISGNGLETSSYLYGTMHVQDQRVFNFKPGVMEAFELSQIYAMELNPDSMNNIAVMTKMLMKDEISLDDLLKKKSYKKIDQFFKGSLGQSLFLYNRMQPIFTSQLISTRGMAIDQEEALDLYFAKKAKNQNKKIVGLEKIEEQIDAMGGIPYKYQAKMLLKSVEDAYANVEDETMQELFDYYVAGDLENLLKLSSNAEEDEEMEALFEKLLITNRNKVMVDRLIPYIQEEKTFIAVGAAHLGGEHGVIQLLRNLGYTVEAR